IVVIIVLFTSIGIITTSKPSSRLASPLFSSWMVYIDQSIFFYLYGMENRGFSMLHDNQSSTLSMTEMMLQLVTSVQMNEAKSLLGNEIPGFSTYENKIVVASEGLDDIDPFSHESGPPLETILKDREAIDDTEDKKEVDTEKPEHSTEGKRVVFLYNSHNRESFLPHLPEETNTDNAYHKEVNITKISDRIAKGLEQNGIGAQVDDTDMMQTLQDKNWKYGKSYDASRPVIKEAMASNEAIQY